MFRKTVTKAALLRALMLGAGTASLVASTTVLTACGYSEDQPEYWLQKMQDRKWRKKAVGKLIQMYENAHNKAEGESDPEKKLEYKKRQEAVKTKIVKPLTDVYVAQYESLPVRSRIEIIKFLASVEDKAALPAFKKAYEMYNKKPPTASTDPEEQDLKFALRATTDLKLTEVAPQLIEAVFKTDVNHAVGRVMFNEMREPVTLLAKTDAGKAWVGTLKKQLEAPFPLPPHSEDKRSAAFKAKMRTYIEKLKRKANWQELAAIALGEIGDTSGIPVLMKLAMDSTKPQIAAQGTLALVKMGKPAMVAALKVLKDEDEALADFYLQQKVKAVKARKGEEPDEKELKKLKEEKGHVKVAANILGVLGRTDAEKPMIELMKASEDEELKTTIALELSNLPKTEESVEAFKDVMKSASFKTKLGQQTAPEVLAGAISSFGDPKLIDFTINVVDSAKGQKEDKQFLAMGALDSIIKLAEKGDLEKVDDVTKTWMKKFSIPRGDQKSMLTNVAKAKVVLEKCDKKFDCYLEQASTGANQSPNQLKPPKKGEKEDKKAPIEIPEKVAASGVYNGAKAAIMLPMYGSEKDVPKIIEKLPQITNPQVRSLVALAIDKLSPKGNKEAANKLEDMVNRNRKSGDQRLIAADAILSQVMHRLRAK